MSNLIVTMTCSFIEHNVEPNGFYSKTCSLKKEFKYMKIPSIKCRILLCDDAIKYIDFTSDYITYDPEENTYHVRNSYITRYDSNRTELTREQIMKKVVDKFKTHGWTQVSNTVG